MGAIIYGGKDGGKKKISKVYTLGLKMDWAVNNI